MKKLIQFSPIAALVALLSLSTLLSSCKKDKKDDDQPQEKFYRLTSVSFTEDGEEYTTTISYNASNKISKFADTENGVEYYRSNWAWNGDQVKITETYFNGSAWITTDTYEELTYLNGHVATAKYYTGDTLVTATAYMWNGDLLTTENVIHYDAGTVEIDYSIKYIYEGSLLTSAEWYTQGMMVQKQVVEYANGKPVGLKLYDPTDVLYESSGMIYTGENITSIERYDVVEGVEGEVNCTEERFYDVNNCVTSVTTSCDGEASYSQQATYEEGKSNFNDFLLTQISWISVYLFPDTFPCELAYKKK